MPNRKVKTSKNFILDYKFCEMCGSSMAKGKEMPWITSYDHISGEPTGEIQYTLKCKKLNTLKGRLGFAGHHDDFLVVYHPHSPVTQEPHKTFLRRTY